MDDRITKHFKYSEFSKSDTASRLHLNNAITDWEVRDNIKALVENVLQPLRDAWGGPIFINSGYRSPEVNKAVGGVETSQHCFDENTEILTTNGWKTYDTISKDDIVLSYNIESEVIEPTQIEDIIIRDFEGELLGFVNKQLDVLTTDKHRMLVRYDSHKYKRKTSKEYSENGRSYFDSLKTENDKWHIELAENVFGKRRKYKSAGNAIAWNEADVLFYKMCMAVISDGYFCHKKATNGVGVGFRFKKERKCQQLESLLNELGWHYTKNFDKNGVWNYYLRFEYGSKIFSVIGKEKHIPYEVLSFGSDIIKELVMYYSLYDGCNDKRDGCNTVNISTIIKHNADMLQAMCALCNMRCVCTKKERVQYCIKGATGVGKDYYTLSINTLMNESKVHEERYYKKDYKGVVWCVNNKNTTLVVRRNGRVSIQGNCKGQAADCGCTDPYALAKLAKRMKLDYDQCIIYSSFVHFSYRRDGENRNQLLYNKSYKGPKDI